MFGQIWKRIVILILVLLYKKETFDTVSIYVPYQITSSDIFDLSQIIKEEPVMRWLFNKKCSITTSSIEDVYDVKFEDYCMKVIPKEMCLEGITKIEEGTLITLKVSQWSENNIAYIRFRLPYKSLSNYIVNSGHTYIEALESPIIKEKYLYNFRLNEERTLPKEVLKDMNDLLNIRTINFFICIPNKYSISLKEVSKVRIFEEKVFEKYIPKKIFRKNITVYQWDYNENSKYTLSTFFERKYINWLSVVTYSVAIIVLNIISNFIFQIIG